MADNIERRNHGIEDGIDAAHDVGVGALELILVAAFGQLSFLRRFGQAGQFLLQRLEDHGHVVDGLLHLFVVALVGLGDQLVDLAVGNLGQDAVAFADGQQDGIQHGVHAAHDVGIGALKLVGLAALGELSVFGCSVNRFSSFCRPCSTAPTLLMACFIFSWSPL